MADWTAITGIVVSGVVGPSLGAWWAQRRLRSEHAYDLVRHDRAEVRGLLAEATRDLHLAERLTGALAGTFRQHGASFRLVAGEGYERCKQAGQAADTNDARLELVLGVDHPVTVAHRAAFRTLNGAFNAMAMAGDGTFSVDDATAMLVAFDRDFAGELLRFRDAAHKLAAAQLAVRPARRRRGR